MPKNGAKMSNASGSTYCPPEELKKTLLAAPCVTLFGHERPDGDCVGATVAVALWLRSIGKKAVVYLPGGVPERYFYLVGGLGLNINPPQQPECPVACAFDTASSERLADYRSIFDGSRIKCVVDHHPDNSMPGDVRWIVPEASSVCEMLFGLMGESGARTAGERLLLALYTGIVTDTGRFSYGNTTATTLETAASLVRLGARPEQITDVLYRSRRTEELLIEGRFLSSLRLYDCLLYTSPSPRDRTRSRMPSSA
mgnify:CR=1 FL=1